MYLENFTSKISHFSFFLLVFQFSTFSQQHTFTSFSPSHVGTGYIVTLRGTNLTSVTGVNFGGTAASSFTIVNTTTIRAVVGEGTTGSVSVLKTGFTTRTGAYTYIWETSTSISGPFIVILGADENTYTPSLNVAATNYFRVKITSFSPFAISSRWGLGYISPLPVELLDFTAKCLEDNTVKIDWSTASENNSSYFEVRKSIDGYTWNTINTIPAAGNSTELLEYSILDREVSLNNVYYRLNQVDIDGKSELFDVVTSNCIENETTNLLITFPNPSSTEFYVDFNSENIEGEGILSITDSRGVLVCSQNVKIEKGNNFYTVGETNEIDGVYYINLQSDQFKSNVVKHIIK